MSTTTRAEIERVVKTFVEHSNRQDLEACVALYHPDGELQDPLFPDPVKASPETVREALEYFWTAFPDANFVVHDMIIDGDKVAVEWTLSATHAGAYLDAPPSGKRFQVRNVALFRVKDGMFVRDFSVFDATGLRTLEALARETANSRQ